MTFTQNKGILISYLLIKLSDDQVIIPHENLTAYLLVPKERDDKSQFLAQAGFTQDNPNELDTALRRLIQEHDAIADRNNEYGTFYQVTGALHGTLKTLAVVTVWLHIAHNAVYRFITLKPNKEE